MEIIKNKKEIERVKTHIIGLDENLEGGIPINHTVLFSGTAGTMKSSITFNILYNEALDGNTGLYLTLEQSTDSLLNHMVNLDFDLSKINLIVIPDISNIEKDIKSATKKGSLIIADLGAIRKKLKDTKFSSGSDWLNAIFNLIKKVAKSTDLKLFVLDSLAALYVLSKFEDPRSKLFFIFESLRDLNLTSYLISEAPYSRNNITEFGVEEYLADGVIQLQLTERYRKVTREISIVKMRTTNCNLDIFTLEYKNGKFQAMYGGKTPVI
ncbi:hypothetical protein GOV14_00315 [Candidatus Pacearchaeota archaeon]|nr:hypothetical protein [Candidatus Pacearchaeota archaeon]